MMLFVSLMTNAQSLGEAVDLGLSVKWASHNIGAKSDEQTGALFAWGETETKKEFSDSNYKYRNGDSGWTIDIGKEISATKYDVARSLWDGDWRMPTQKEMLELCNNCAWEWIGKKGVYGYRITGPNGNSIFLPANADKEGQYWSGTLSQGLGRTSIALLFSEERHYTFGTYKTQGMMIRPVMTNPDYSELMDVPEEWKDQKYAALLKSIQEADYDTAFVEASMLAGAGDPQAQCVLASMFCFGAGTFQNYEAAQEQLASAAAHGYERAEYMMGGFGSLDKKHEFMKALLGEADTSSDISFWQQMMYSDSLPENYKEAFRWFLLADGEWGFRDIMYYCGIALITGAYGYQNEEHGLNWIIRSAQMGYPDAQNLINQLIERSSNEK